MSLHFLHLVLVYRDCRWMQNSADFPTVLSPLLYPNHSPAPISRHISLSAAWVASGEHQGMPHKPSETAYLPTHLPNYPSSAAKQTSAPCRPWGERRSLDLKGRAPTWWWGVNCPGRAVTSWYTSAEATQRPLFVVCCSVCTFVCVCAAIGWIEWWTKFEDNFSSRSFIFVYFSMCKQFQL